MQQRAIHRIGANFSWLAGERVLRLVIGLFVLGYVSRYLQPERFGLLNYAINLTALFAAVANAGIDGIVIRELVRKPDEAPALLGTGWCIKFAGALICIGMIGVVGLFEKSSGSIYALILLVSLGFLPQSFDVIDLWFQRHIQSKFTVMAKMGAIVASAAVKISLVSIKAPLIWFAVAQALDMAFLACGLVIVYLSRDGRISKWRFSLEIAKGLLRDSWPLILSGIVVAIYMRIEQFLVMNRLGSESAGIYYASVRVSDIWNMLPALLLPSLYPLLLQKREENVEVYKARLQDVFDILTFAGLVVAVGVTIAAPFIIWIIYGAKYAGASGILMIQAWSAPFTFAGSVRAQYFIIEKLTLYHTWSALLGIVANVALAMWLLPKIGARGAALAAVVGYAVSAYFSSLLFKKLWPCAVYQTRAFLSPFRLPSLIAKFRGS